MDYAIGICRNLVRMVRWVQIKPLPMKTIKKLYAFVIRTFILCDYSLVSKKNFPGNILLARKKGSCALYIIGDRNIILTDFYEKIQYDPSGKRFLARSDNQYYLIDCSGRIVFATYSTWVHVVTHATQGLFVLGDGTYLLTIENRIANTCREAVMDPDGKIVDEWSHYSAKRYVL